MTGTAAGDRTIADWLTALASDSATPGGGAVAGLSGAAGAALLAMTARLTVGREEFADVEGRMRDLIERADEARRRFLELADADAQAFDGVMRAFRMPKETDDQRSVRSAAIQRGYVEAARVPLDVARAAVDLMPLAEDATALGNPQAASDGYSGAVALYAAVRCALANVVINASSLKDEHERRALTDDVTSLRARAEELLEQAETAFNLRTLP